MPMALEYLKMLGKPLPTEIREHCFIYFEEETYTQAIHLLTSLLSSSTSRRPPTPAIIPSPHVLALLATLTVHPVTTTRAETSESASACKASLHYLRTVITRLSPASSRLPATLTFTRPTLNNGSSSTRRSSKRQLLKHADDCRDSGHSTGGADTPRSSTTSESEYDSDDALEVDNPFAGHSGLYKRAEGFWSTVGWAFICSIRHRHRWVYWKHWLAFTLDVLEADWAERLGSSTKGVDWSQGERNAVGAEVLEGSLAMTYIRECNGSGRTARRKMLRAILADGNAKDTQEFVAVWKSEMKPVKAEEETKNGRWNSKEAKRKRLDLDEGEFGDYGDVEDADEEDEIEREGRGSLRAGRIVKRRTPYKFDPLQPDRDDVVEGGETDGNAALTTNAGSIDAFGGMEALLLRRRLLVLLTTVSAYLAGPFTSLEDLLDIYTEFLRPLPLPVFAYFVSPTASTPTSTSTNHTTDQDAGFPDTTMTALHAMLLRPLLSHTQHQPYEYAIPTQSTLQTAFLPHAAASASVIDSAKVAVVLESILRISWRHGGLKKGQGLKAAVENGVKARRAKVERGRGGGGKWKKEAEAEAEEWLNNAEARMGLVVDAVEGV